MFSVRTCFNVMALASVIWMIDKAPEVYDKLKKRIYDKLAKEQE